MVGSTELETTNEQPNASFWECREYLRTVKRVDAANKLCNELCLMVQERAELEKAYSANLKRWSNRWLSFLDSGLEYGTATSPWKGLCKEADAISNAHQSIKNLLVDEIQTGLKQWQKEHFHKNPLPPQALKETKQFEQDFEIAQKPWAKRLKKMLQCKKDYHQACKMERSLQVQVQNARNDPAGTPEQLKKIEEKLRKIEKDVERTRSAYTSTLSDLDSESPRYLEEMTRVFERTQAFERERLIFFKELFMSMHRSLNVTLKADFDSIYRDLEKSIAQLDVESDLAWWSSHHGVDMPVVLPQFEEYSPELTTISRKKRSQVSDANAGVTLTGVTPVISPPTQVPRDYTSDTKRNGSSPTDGLRSGIRTPFDDLTPASDASTFEPEAVVAATDSPATNVLAPEAPGPDEMSDADYYALATYDDGRPGVPVRALYDYTGQEEDELTFVAGDQFEKLEEADDQGWCKGRKDGRCGLYPANYVEHV